MEPRDFRRLSTLYLYNEISPEEKKRFEAHLEKCQGCRQELEDMKQTLEMLQNLPSEEPSPELRRVILEIATERKNRKKNLWENYLKVIFNYHRAFRVGLAVMVLIIGIFLAMAHFTSIQKSNIVLTSPSVAPDQEISGLLSSNIEKRIEELKIEIKRVKNPELSFNETLDFYDESKPVSQRIGQPFSDSRPFREYVGLQSQAENLRKNISIF